MIRRWLAGVVRFRTDPEGVSLSGGGTAQVDDYLRDPITEQYAQLRQTGEIRGDCDDVAILGATLALGAGLSVVRLRVVSFSPVPPFPYSHVFAEVLTSRGWLDFDVTRRAGSGPRVTRTATVMA